MSTEWDTWGSAQCSAAVPRIIRGYHRSLGAQPPMPKTETETPSAASALATVLPVLHSPIAVPKVQHEDGPPCHLCTARCCKYFALQIDPPGTPEDYDSIRWYLMHEGAVVWMSEGDWYLEVRTRCKHLQPDNSCGIYDSRPQICRDYGLPENAPCEFFTDRLQYELFFDSDTDFDEWVTKSLKLLAAEREKHKAKRKKKDKKKRKKKDKD